MIIPTNQQRLPGFAVRIDVINFEQTIFNSEPILLVNIFDLGLELATK